MNQFRSAAVAAVIVALAGCAVDEEPALEMPPSAFQVRLGQLVAPISAPDGTVVASARVVVSCEAPARVVACVRVTDPSDASGAEVWCRYVDDCGPQIATLTIEPVPHAIGDHCVAELVVAASALPSVRIRGASVLLQ